MRKEILFLTLVVLALVTVGCSRQEGPQKIQPGDYEGPPKGAAQAN